MARGRPAWYKSKLVMRFSSHGRPRFARGGLRAASLLGLAALASAACDALRTGNQAPKAVVLQAVYVRNPDLPSLSLAEYRKMLGIMEEAFMREWAQPIRLVDRGRMPIDAYFDEYLRPVETENPYREYYFKAGEDDPEALKKAFLDVWADLSLDDLVRSLRSYAGCGHLERSTTKEELADGVVMCHLHKYEELRVLRLENGQPLLTGAPYEQYLNWEWLSRNQKDFEVVVTNQLIASIETYTPALHSSLRGGVSTGVTYKSKTLHEGMVVMSTFPLLSDLPYFRRERGYAASDPRSLEITAWYQTHELGHLLLQYDHPIDHAGCTMNFAVGFGYLEWYDDVMANGPRCAKPHKILKTF